MKRYVKYALFAVPVLLIAMAFATKDQWDWLLEDGTAKTVGAAAPALEVDEATERLYRIASDDKSSVAYSVQETLAGSSKIAQGSTPAVAGDIAINTLDPSASRVGTIVVNIEQFESDSTLRDKRIRTDFLNSSEYPMAEFEVSSIEGLPDSIGGETSDDISISGELTVAEETAPATFSGQATVTDDELTATLTGTVLMSDYGVGPINVAGLVKTGDEVELTFSLVADRTDPDEPPPAGAVLIVGSPEIPQGDFAEVVQPIIEQRCASCHTGTGAGTHTIELETAGDVAEIADEIKLVTQAGYMPPWPAGELSVPMKHDFSIEADEVDSLAAWADAGGGLDVPADTPLEAAELPADPIERDIVTAPAEPYTGSRERADDYRCVISEIPDPEGDGTWVKGVHFEPDATEIVHHSIISVVSPESRETIDELDAAEAGSGFTCYGQVGSLGEVKSRGLGGWTPGRQPTVYPDGYATFLESGSFIVNQVHYHYDHDEPPDQSAIVLDTIPAEEVAELEAARTPLKQIRGRTLINPAEGPCTPQESGPLCDRDNVLEEIGQKYGGFARALPDVFVAMCGGTVDDYDDLDGTRFSSTCDHRYPFSGTVSSVLPHMHEFGAAYRMTLNPDTPDELVLIDIPKWNFDWQLHYQPEGDIHIDAGDIVRVTCTWDRSLVDMPEPRYITWSDGTVDEMCFSPLSVLPDE
ncbi:MAG: YceI family protein [Microthrixaceae bacterium]